MINVLLHLLCIQLNVPFAVFNAAEKLCNNNKATEAGCCLPLLSIAFWALKLL